MFNVRSKIVSVYYALFWKFIDWQKTCNDMKEIIVNTNIISIYKFINKTL